MSEPPTAIDPSQLLTQIGEFEERLTALSRELESSRRLASIGMLAAFVAHEYANLLSPVTGYCQAALRHPEDLTLTTKALAESAKRSLQASRISRIILELSNPRQISLPCRIAEALHGLEPDGELRIESAIPPDAIALIDPDSLRHIVLNLVFNARQAGATFVTLSCATWNDSVSITIADNGVGIPEHQIKKIREPGFSSQRRTGLGLALCDRLVHAAGGTLEIESIPQSGTIMTLRLPQSSARKNGDIVGIDGQGEFAPNLGRGIPEHQATQAA